MSLPLFVHCLQVFEGSPIICKKSLGPSEPDDCYHYTIFCENQTERQEVQKCLQSFMPPDLNFNVEKPIKQANDQQGTHWALFAGPGNKSKIELLYSLIEGWSKPDECRNCKNIVKCMCRWGGTAYYHVFHLAIRCNPQMVAMVKRLYTIRDAESIPRQPARHDLMNAAGEPIVYIATRMGKLEVVKHLLSQKPEAINAKVGAGAYTLLHVVAGTEHRSVVQFLMSGDRTPRIDYRARDIHGCSALECALERSFSTATSIYNNIPFGDRCYLDGNRLLTRIIGNCSNSVEKQVEMAKKILDDLRLLPIDTSSSPYNVALDCYINPIDEREEKAAKQIWKLLIDHSVPIGGYNFHGSTLLARTVEHAPPEFLLDLLNSAEVRIKLNEEHLNWLSVDKDGDTPQDIAKRRIDASILGIVESGIQRQREAHSLEHFVAMEDYQSVVGIHFALGGFKSCLRYLNLLEFSEWGQCTKARCCLRLERREEALTSLVGVKRCPAVLRLESNILTDIDHLRALRMNRAAYQEETRRNEKIALQRELLSTILSVYKPAAGFSTKLRELILEHVTEP